MGGRPRLATFAGALMCSLIWYGGNEVSLAVLRRGKKSSWSELLPDTLELPELVVEKSEPLLTQLAGLEGQLLPGLELCEL